MSEMAHMDIIIDLALKSRLAALAETTHRDESALVGEAIAHFLDVQDWQRVRIEKGIAAGDRGEFATPEEVERVFIKAVFRLAGFTPEALRHPVAECGASQIVMGTDYSYPWTSTARGLHSRRAELERRRAGRDPR